MFIVHRASGIGHWAESRIHSFTHSKVIFLPCSPAPLLPCSPASLFLQGYDFKIYPVAGKKSAIKLPIGKGIPLIKDAKIVKKPRRKQLNKR
ncbi:MAG: hypothetical protein ACRC11_09040, partial [Xenococcaceae cyanobacterium]